LRRWPLADKVVKDGELPGLEESLARLEEIVESLESGEIPLEESLALFEEGVSIIKRVNRTLDEAEKRVETLVKTGLKTISGSPADEE
jgi:exodeoxyribonuclease VII small subunit